MSSRPTQRAQSRTAPVIGYAVTAGSRPAFETRQDESKPTQPLNFWFALYFAQIQKNKTRPLQAKFGLLLQAADLFDLTIDAAAMQTILTVCGAGLYNLGAVSPQSSSPKPVLAVERSNSPYAMVPHTEAPIVFIGHIYRFQDDAGIPDPATPQYHVHQHSCLHNTRFTNPRRVTFSNNCRHSDDVRMRAQDMRSADKFLWLSHTSQACFCKPPVRYQGGRDFVATIYEQADAYVAQNVPPHKTRKEFFYNELPWTVNPVHQMPYAFIAKDSAVCVPMDTLNHMSEVDAEFDLRHKDFPESRLPCYAFDQDFFCHPDYHIFFTNTLVVKEDHKDEFYVPSIAPVPDTQEYNLDTARTPQGFRDMLEFLRQKYGETRLAPFVVQEVPALRGALWKGD